MRLPYTHLAFLACNEVNSFACKNCTFIAHSFLNRIRFLSLIHSLILAKKETVVLANKVISVCCVNVVSLPWLNKLGVWVVSCNIVGLKSQSSKHICSS